MGTSAALDTDPERLAAMFDVNVTGTLRMVQAFTPALARTSGSKYRSKILNIGTVISGGAPWHTGYASTKVSGFLLQVGAVNIDTAGRFTGHERCYEAGARTCRNRRHHPRTR